MSGLKYFKVTMYENGLEKTSYVVSAGQDYAIRFFTCTNDGVVVTSVEFLGDVDFLVNKFNCHDGPDYGKGEK